MQLFFHSKKVSLTNCHWPSSASIRLLGLRCLKWIHLSFTVMKPPFSHNCVSKVCRRTTHDLSKPKFDSSQRMVVVRNSVAFQVKRRENSGRFIDPYSSSINFLKTNLRKVNSLKIISESLTIEKVEYWNIPKSKDKMNSKITKTE